jgi:hypothetical protein
MIERLWGILDSTAQLSEMLDAISTVGLGQPPGFALIHLERGAEKAILRGSATIQIDDASGRHVELSCPPGVRTWLEHPAGAGIVNVRLSSGTAADDGPWLPVLHGVALASVADFLELGPHEVPMTTSWDSRDRPSAVAPGRGTAAIPAAEIQPTPEGDAHPMPEVALQTTAPVSAHYDHLFEATQRRTVEEAAVRNAGIETTEGDTPDEIETPATQEDIVDPSVTLAEAPDSADGIADRSPTSSPDAPSSSRLIASVPGVAAEPAPTSSPLAQFPKPRVEEHVPGGNAAWQCVSCSAGNTPAQRFCTTCGAPGPMSVQALEGDSRLEQPGPIDDRTVNRSEMRALSAAAANHPPGPVVQAVRCPVGHPNPPHNNTCRVCHAGIGLVTPTTMPRPVLGRLRISTGDSVTLDRGALFGRSPQTPEGVGSDRPHVVRLPSPNQDISRTHLKVTLDGWHVLVTDLRSTNGTVITAPGQPPQRLRSGEAVPIVPGTIVNLADEVTFVYEVEP